MIQPKYSPEEALQRMKLMMEYDSSKTYTENKKIILEEPITLLGLTLAQLAGVIAGTGAVAGLGGLAAEWSSKDTKEKYNVLALSCGKNDAKSKQVKRATMGPQEHAKIAGLFRKSFSYTFGGFGIGGGTDLDILAEALGMLEKSGNFGDFCKVRETYGPKFDSDLISELNESELTDVLNMLEVILAKSSAGNVKVRDAETANTEWWLETFPCLEKTDSFADPITVDTDRYGNSYVTVNFKVKGQLKPFHILQDSSIYTGDTHKFTGKKVACSGNKVTVVSESVKKKPLSEQADLGNIDLNPVDADFDGGKPTPTGGVPTPTPKPRPSFVGCKGLYKKGCKSEVIKKVQGCLGGLTQDGLFGSKTEAKLNQLFPDLGGSFRDNEVDKICKKEDEKLTSDVEIISTAQSSGSQTPTGDIESTIKTGIS